MPQFELIYFPISGRAGIARLLFDLAGVKFTDTQIAFQEWPSKKSDRKRIPFGQLPVLRVDNTVIAEARPINEYIAGEFGFLGNTSLERARISSIAHVTFNEWESLVKSKLEKDKDRAKSLQEKFFGEQLPNALSNLEIILKDNNGGDGYFIGEKISLADVAFMDLTLTIQKGNPSILDNYPKLDALHHRLVALPIIANHIPNRKYPSF